MFRILRLNGPPRSLGGYGIGGDANGIDAVQPKLLAKVEARLDADRSEADTQDAQAEGVPAAPGPHASGALAEKIALLRERQGRDDGLLNELTPSGQDEVSLTDADCRKMKGAHGENFPGCNVQVAVDARHDLIVSEDVVQAANVRGQLGTLAVDAKQRGNAGRARFSAWSCIWLSVLFGSSVEKTRYPTATLPASNRMMNGATAPGGKNARARFTCATVSDIAWLMSVPG